MLHFIKESNARLHLKGLNAIPHAFGSLLWCVDADLPYICLHIIKVVPPANTEYSLGVPWIYAPAEEIFTQ